ncbi:hypothetical protein CAURIC_11405 [Corynebacterium auriscanis]|nr:hypothetical protein CAURIC_02480 [Corynebacterium auriscanis]WJY72225.1 hypothetical protein CAURIC_02795 [Corynebacterium auriscanis]WJY73338.1 hypothetical protein CAURIC_08670 [Corynebacterium auriscanis]WJY73868.1 hypothetical protein CAURIC_11405 [Corynebacterium auriscanis]
MLPLSASGCLILWRIGLPGSWTWKFDDIVLRHRRIQSVSASCGLLVGRRWILLVNARSTRAWSIGSVLNWACGNATRMDDELPQPPDAAGTYSLESMR